MKLLTAAASNAKTAKNSMHTQFISYILHLAPADLSGYNLCPMASVGCKAACLNSAGRGAFSNVQAARIRKSRLFMERRAEFIDLLNKDLQAVERKAEKLAKKAVVRLNGTSDIAWETVRAFNGKNVFEAYPNIQFYDYTKIPRRMARQTQNYYLIFSASELNSADCLAVLKQGFNVAMVFDAIPKQYKGFEVINGDEHDLRFLEPHAGRIIGLKAKGKARKDASGFVRKTINCQIGTKGA